jgi:hypothetical protein
MISMLINNFHFSALSPCGIAIFSQHLRQALARLGNDVLVTNLISDAHFTHTPLEILHYAPSSFASAEGSQALIDFLKPQSERRKLIVILHGLYSLGENRFLDDARCPDQADHIRLMFNTAEIVVPLSESVAASARIWCRRLGSSTRIIRMDHPGLFVSSVKIESEYPSYALVCGIARPKKNPEVGLIPDLLELCQREGIHVWQHWTNLKPPEPVPPAWMQTYGAVSDSEWSRMISHAKVLLCPYRTRIQSVSGVISEALSARRFIISTPFDLALEMKARAPGLVTIEDDIRCWPALIRNLPQNCGDTEPTIPTWNSFADLLASELAGSQPKENLFHRYDHHP